MPRFLRVSPFLLIPLVAALGACSSAKPNKFQDDQLLSSAPSPFSRNFSYASADACEASRRALLSQGYMTTMTHNDTVDATKNFQPTNDQHIVVEVHVVCTVADASNTSVVYVNAVQNGYALKKSDTSASVGLSILGSVSLPIRSNSDEMVKVSSETIQSGAFYTRFFDLVSRYLNTVAKSEPIPGSGAIKITPLPPSLEPVTALANAGAPGVSTPGVATPGTSAAPAAAVAAAATGAAVAHTDTLPATPVLGAMQPIQPVQATQSTSAVHAVMPVAPAATATLLTPVVPAAVAAAASAASAAAPASAPVAAADHAASQSVAAAPAATSAASAASAVQASAATPASAAQTLAAASPAATASAASATPVATTAP
ncbi:MAG TPA: DUF2242 domain-containing protein [Paraburkholderia sp.]|jgi:hypothetical protein|uniref:DUF2242 domain-containing protein n=1 Tax=Paraburkholderia sp. TaxID=1926495 RepID=UPI002DF70B9C|nr:DUF2242 domain-containing protein [Paraburkholderia sp.]